MNKDKITVLQNDDIDKLRCDMLGYNHDHCWTHYFGKMENVPEKLKDLISEDKRYVFICEED